MTSTCSTKVGSHDMRMLNVPRPYPDELLYSVLARFTRHHRIDTPRTALQRLVGNAARVPSVLLPMRLGPLQQHFRNHWGMSAKDVAFAHTLLPFFLVGKPRRTMKNALNSVSADRPQALSQSLGVNAGAIKLTPYLRYCERCVEADRETYGEAYWHRMHQLPGSLVCPLHGKLLRISSARVRPVFRQALMAAEAAIDIEADGMELVSAGDMSLALAIALRNQQHLDRNLSVEPSAGDAIPMPWSTSIGASGAKEMRRLEEAFTSYYGASLLSSIEPRWEPGRSLSWVAALRRAPRRPLHPVRWVLLEQFFTDGHWPTRASAFGTGPWVCRNPLAAHGGKPVVDHIERIVDARHPERVIARFRCKCGFVYSRYASDDPQYGPIRVIDFGPLYRRRARQLAKDGLSMRAIAQALGVAWQTAANLLQAAEVMATESVERCEQHQRDRDAWLSLVERNPDDGVLALRRMAPALYGRLYRKDRGWLRRHAPRRNSVRVTRPRVDWNTRDIELARRFRTAAQMLSAEAPNVRVTRTGLAKRLGCQATIEKNLYRLPKTRAVLEEVCESHLQYRVRRLREAQAALGEDAPAWQVMRRSGLRTEKLTDEVMDLAFAKQTCPGG